MPPDKNIARTRNLQLAVPTDTDVEAGPCTPTYEFPVSLPHPRHMLNKQDGSSSSHGLTLTPSPRVTGKRGREEEEWADAEVEMLQNVLNRPSKDALFAPGSMPPPHVLDDLTSAVVGQFGGSMSFRSQSEETEPAGGLDMTSLSTDSPMADGYDASTEPSPCPSERGSRLSSPQPPAWPHSWEETRRMLTTLALADTRLGHEREERKLTRQERLARPGIRRVDSMDFLDDASTDAQPSEKLGRALRLSTKLQNSARETPALIRAASLGAPAGSGSQVPSALPVGVRPTPPSAYPARPFGITLTSTSPNVRPAPMRRNSSARSDRSTSRRPSLLAIGRNFTASDLEAEAEEVLRESVSAPISHVTSTVNVAPDLKTPTGAFFHAGGSTSGALGLDLAPGASRSTGSDDTAPRRPASAPDMLSLRLTRSHSYSAALRREPRYESRGTSHDFGGPGRQPLGLGLPPAPVHQDTASLGAAFDPAQAPPKPAGEWDSDSDRDGVVSVKRRARGPALAMTAIAGAAAVGPGVTPTASASITPSLPKLIIEETGDANAPTLGSPFEERPMESMDTK